MKPIQAPNRHQVSEASQPLFDQQQKRLGTVPNLYATIGYLSTALQAFLQFDEQFSHGVFTSEKRETIALAVSEGNSCTYYLAAHTLAAKVRGFSLDDTLAIRRASVADPTVLVALQLAQSIAKTGGTPTPAWSPILRGWL